MAYRSSGILAQSVHLATTLLLLGLGLTASCGVEPAGSSGSTSDRASSPGVLTQSLETAIWEDVTPASGPTSRYRMDAVYDSTAQRLVMFGGANLATTAVLGDTQDWNGSTWVPRCVDTCGPPARRDHAMAFDSTRNVVVMFGGRGSGLLNDTWELPTAGSVWTSTCTNCGPSPRSQTAVAFDSVNNEMVLFSGSGASNDTWTYNGSWTQVCMASPGCADNTPTARRSHAMAYDEDNDEVILFGGTQIAPSTIVGDTWTWNGSGWTRECETGACGPTPRTGHRLVYDQNTRRVILFGGFNTSDLDDTWEWDGSQWTQIPGTAIGGASSHAMAYDAARNRVTAIIAAPNAATPNPVWTYHTRGGDCTADGDCDTGHCVDGVCCLTAECGVCETCNGTADAGTCTPVTSGTDDTCPSVAAGCSGPNCACGVNGCALDLGASCVSSGDCAAGHCVDGVCCNSACSGNCNRCDGGSLGWSGATDGTCQNAPDSANYAPSTCGGHVCEFASSACPTACSNNGDCASTHYCNASSSCVSKKPQGQACNPTTECRVAGCELCSSAGGCVDGYCCNTTCNGTCEACSAALKGSGGNGVCGDIANGTDPSNECPDNGPGACGTDGSCNGSGACRAYPVSTVCAAPECSDSQLTTSRCESFGNCAPTHTACSGAFACLDAASCRTACGNDDHCAPGAYCSGTQCVSLKPNGAACSAGNECTSTHCVDGRCCNEACDGTCEACSAALKQSGTGDGTCGAARAGSPSPRGAGCATEAASTCGTTGMCDGTLGGCALHAFGTRCAADVCVTGEVREQVCDGTGTCSPHPGESTPCSPYACAGGSCASPCTTSTDCIADYFCNSGTCSPIVDPGTPCTVNSECSTNFCVDGFCCDTACNGVCMACSAALKESGAADGSCGPARADNPSPRGACAVSGTDCGTTGLCGPTGSCAVTAFGEECDSPVCQNNESHRRSCNGSGQCVTDTDGTDCAPSLCSGGSCNSGCVNDDDCVSGFYCASGTCSAQGGLGDACTADNQCQGRHCVDGVCCDGPCNGTCEACSAALKQSGLADGVCGPSTAGEASPRGSCTAQPEATCLTNGLCDGTGSCQLHPAETTCGANVCVGNERRPRECDGLGTCQTSASGDTCAPYQCATAAGACADPCGTDADCVADHYCNGDSCEPKKNVGDACAGANECVLGHCVDGFCCDTACNNSCEACAAALKESDAQDGVCGPVREGTNSPRAACRADEPTSCGQTGTCDANGNCAWYGSRQACGATTCVDGAQTGNVCDGGGTCVVSSAGRACSPYVCSGNTCAEPCVTHADCVADYFCIDGECLTQLDLGEACARNAECLSGFCTDGVCCDGACTGQCEACDASGACVPHTGAPVGSREPCDGEGACQGRCDGADATACRYPRGGTECREATCEGDVLQPAGTCDGNGTCTLPTTDPCLPFACDAGACRSSCSTDNDCATGAACEVESGECAITGRTCSDAFTVITPSGAETDCRPYRCQAGNCREQCTANSGCADGYLCEDSACVEEEPDPTSTGGTNNRGGTGPRGGADATGGQGTPPGSAGDAAKGPTSGGSKDSGGCGCRVPAPSQRPAMPLVLAGLALWIARRRRRPARVEAA